MKKIMCFTHWDLDGVVSYLVLRWAFPKAIVEVEPCKVDNFREVYTKWLSTHDLEDYDKVFILDLGIFEDKDLIDNKRFFIIDHHPGHGEYKNATAFIKEGYSSACKLAFKAFKKIYKIKPTKAQLYLLALADDYDSYKLDLKESAKLNTVFWGMNDKFESFTKSFINGFYGFNLQQQNIITLDNLKLQKVKESLDVYGAKLKIQNKERQVCSTFAHERINDIADILINNYKAEIAIVVNTKTNHVSYRRARDSDVNLGELAEKIADGGGHEYASGSNITKKFILFTKSLSKI